MSKKPFSSTCEKNKKPFSSACEKNKKPILEVLKEIISPENRHLLEIGAGTGQHAIYFASHFRDLNWTISDIASRQYDLKQLIYKEKLKNIHGPIEFEIGKTLFPREDFDLIFLANVFHIISWKLIKTLIKTFGKSLKEGTQVLVYGPFNYEGAFTSSGNKQFDKNLREKDPLSGIRSFEDVKKVMEKNGLFLGKDYEMPANNRLLLFMKIEKVNG